MRHTNLDIKVDQNLHVSETTTNQKKNPVVVSLICHVHNYNMIQTNIMDQQ